MKNHTKVVLAAIAAAALLVATPYIEKTTLKTSVLELNYPAPKELTIESSPICSVNKLDATVGETLFFQANLEGSTYQNYTWFFGDQSNIYKINESQNTTTEYAYKKAGIYQVDLLLNGTRNTDTCSLTLTIHEKASQPVCADGIDNDGDGYVDLKDGGCQSPDDQDESNIVPRTSPACSDGFDNDGDGLTDLQDIGCINHLDSSEDNPLETILPGGEPYQNFCLQFQEGNDQSFKDFLSEDLIQDFLNTSYLSKPIIEVENPHSGLLRSQAFDLLAKTTCIIKDRHYQLPVSELNDQALLTRGEFLKVMIEIDNHQQELQTAECQNPPATDLYLEDWHCRYFNTALERGYIHLLDGNRIYPNLPITKETALIWLNNYISQINSPNF